MTNAQLAKLVASITAEVLKAQKPSHKPISSYKAANKYEKKAKIPTEGRTARQLSNEVAVAKAFKAKGLLVTPRVDALSFKQWQMKGFTVKSGEKGLFVKKVGTMFHSGQVAPTEQMSKAQMTAETANMQSFPA